MRLFILILLLLATRQGKSQCTAGIVILGGDSRFVCNGSLATISCMPSNHGSSATIRIYVNGLLSGTSTASAPIVSFNLYLGASNAQELKVVVTTSSGCTAEDTQMAYNDLRSINSEAILGPESLCRGTGTTQLTNNTGISSNYSWSIDASAGSISNTGLITWNPAFTGGATVTLVAAGCTAHSTTKQIFMYDVPTALSSGTMTVCEWEPFILPKSDSYPAPNYALYDGAGNLFRDNVTELYFEPYNQTGTFSYQVEVIGRDWKACRNPVRANYQIIVTDNCDDKLNWIESSSYTSNGVMVSTAKKYFDWGGLELQSQSKLLTKNRVLAAQPVRDGYNRVVGQTLSAPTIKTDFNYRPDFMLATTGKRYDYLHFDQPANRYNPESLSISLAGTLAYYYSSNNQVETNVPNTSFPYTRNEYYTDGTGEIRKKATVGDVHRLGAGHEILGGSFPVFNELSDYGSKRQVVLGGAISATQVNGAVQSVSRDENGQFLITISDKSGKKVFSAQPGTPDDFVLKVLNIVKSNADPASSDYRLYTYFYLLTAQQISVIGTASYVVEDVITDQAVNAAAVLPVGFYRLKLTSGAVQLSYVNYYKDVSIQFYNDADKMVASVSPNGYKQWSSGADYSVIDKTTYEYNHQGWLLATVEPDAGRSEYVYRKDGQIAFSQNAEQRLRNRFSYTLYDDANRGVESGEYIGASVNFVPMTSSSFSSSPMKALLGQRADQINWPAGSVRDWVRTRYDLPDTGIPSGYVQDFVYGAVSMTENANNRTWYSYDERGLVQWMIQKPTFLPRVFVVKYRYDFTGNVQMVSNLSYDNSGALLEEFYQYYTYDSDNRLLSAYTSTKPDESRKLRATYSYYLHGPLKRIVLGDNMQGVDFVYNIQGWLTQINHPDPAQDPGSDGNDVFGMVLDYYKSDMAGLHTSVPEHDINKRHGLPANHRATVVKHPAIMDTPRTVPVEDLRHRSTPWDINQQKTKP